MSLLMILQLCIVLAALWLGSRYGSLALGAISGIGLAILVFGFGMKPGTPPTDVIYIIIAAVTCAGIMQASGGMDWLIQLAERLLRKHPARITFLAPLCTFFLTVLVGTGHVVYTLMPIICDIAIKKGIRPERPCGIASIASQIGITCSPIAAAVVAFITISGANGYSISIPQVLMVTFPACLLGIILASVASYRRGKDLDKDPEFKKKLADPAQREYIYGGTATTLDKKIAPESKRAVFIFFGALLVIVFFAIFQDLLPAYDTVKALKDAPSVELIGSRVTVTADQLAKDDNLLQGVAQESRVGSRVAKRYGSCCGNLWHRLACRHLFCQLSRRYPGHTLGHGRAVSMVDSLCVLPRFGARQLAGSSGCCHAPAGLQTGH